MIHHWAAAAALKQGPSRGFTPSLAAAVSSALRTATDGRYDRLLRSVGWMIGETGSYSVTSSSIDREKKFINDLKYKYTIFVRAIQDGVHKSKVSMFSIHVHPLRVL